MKKTLLTVFFCAIAIPAFCQPQPTATFTARFGKRTQRPGQLSTVPQGEGAIQKGIRNGNPLQLLNPLAPAKYGSGQDVTVYEFGTDPAQRWRDPRERPVAIRLLSFFFW
jgi:hypothetical protein